MGRLGTYGWMNRTVLETAKARTGLALAVLVVGALLGTLSAPWGPARVADPSADTTVTASLDASTARGAGMGTYYATRYEAAAAASSARWAALGATYTARLTAGLEASTARWVAIGAHYAARYEAAAGANSARYTALAASYGAKTVAVEPSTDAGSTR